MKAVIKFLPITVFVLVAGCAGSSNQDLHTYIKETIDKPAGEIEPVPTFKPYRPYNYSNLAKRSPFQPPQPATGADESGRVVAAPDESRPKEYLEGIAFASLSMVGMLEQEGQIWALINDGSGGIHRVSTGNYMGRNHGKIVNITPSYTEVVEIVPDGKGGWLERPRTLTLKD